MRIIVVEDDTLLADGLERVLTRAGHAVDRAETGADADRLLRTVDYDLAVLDVGLPDADGFDVLRRLRQRSSSTNVLVLTARDAVEDRVRGLDLGADDYLTKPFSVEEFEARVRALLRRPTMPSGPLAFGGLVIDVVARRALVGAQVVEFTPREWAILELLLLRPGRVLSKEEFVERLLVYGETPSANAVEQYVSRIRAKLGAEGVLLHTVRGFGYIWNAGRERAD
jgi:DNA-binding response OmpR family regulator